MTIKELIERLQSAPDPNAKVQIAVRTYTSRSAHAFIEPFDVRFGWGDAAILDVTFPEGFVVSERKPRKVSA